MARRFEEICAERMTRTLASKPRNEKTRAYVQALPSRAKIVVTPQDFGAPDCEPSCFMPIIRKDRVRPRTAGTNHLSPKVVFRKPRDMEQCRVNRIKLFMAQNGRCASCGGKIFQPKTGSLDHCVPLYHGGHDGMGNLVLMHGECNGMKSNRMPNAFEMGMLRRVNRRIGVAGRV